MKQVILVIHCLFFSVIIFAQNKIGIGTTSPTEKLDVIGNIKADTIKTNTVKIATGAASGKVLMSDASGNGSWQTIVTSSGGNNLDGAYDYAGSGLGRTIIADNGAVQIDGTDGLLVTGTFGLGNYLNTIGAGTKMFFYPKRSAFRVGTINSNQWDMDSLGMHSIAMGNNSKATIDGGIAIGTQANSTGINAISLGHNNYASNLGSVAIGNLSDAKGAYAQSIGSSCKALGDYSLAMLSLSTASGEFSIAIGDRAKSTANYAIAIGDSSIASGDHAISIGERNIISSIASNSFAIGKKNNVSNNSSFAIGETNSVSSSLAMSIGFDNSTIGTFKSVCIGHNNNSTGTFSSTCIGENNLASGTFNCLAIGADNVASGDMTLALGHYNDAIGDRSSAFGYSTQTHGLYANSFGYITSANGQSSATMGEYTNSNSYSGFVVGRFNDTIVPVQTTIDSISPLFIIGNGTSNTNRKNAFVVRNDANIGVNTSTPNSNLEINGSFAASIKKVSTNYTLNKNDYTIIIPLTVGATALTLTLPLASSCEGRTYNIINHNTSAKTYAAPGVILISGVISTSIPAQSAYRIQSDGVNWYRIN